MRVLFTTQPGIGMFHPLVPFAHALEAAGHEVTVACADCFRPDVEATGLVALPAGIDWRNDLMTQAFPDAPPAGPARMPWINALWRYTTARAMVPDLLAIAERWRPDLFVREGLEYGGCLTAELLGVPYASAGAHWFPLLAPQFVPLDAARSEFGLPPDPTGEQLYRYLNLAPMPPRWIAPDEEAPPTTHFVRPPSPGVGDGPAWLADMPSGRPLVHVTLGTTEVTQTPGLYEAILTELRDEPINLVVAVGRHRDPAAFGPQPPHVRVERVVDHGALLPRCDLVVSHGGFSTIMGSLAAGVPLVVIPVQGDQPRNARRCVDLGVGRMVHAEARESGAIRAATRAVLADSACRTNAQRLREEIAALPGTDRAVELLERLAVDRQPLLAAPPVSPSEPASG